ncbi:MAG: RIP metalloprotease RseP [Rhizomicrobium sp.]
MLGALQGLVAWAPLGLPSFLFLITVVVFFHELGHFSVARYFGVKVETFSIGFGPEIFGWTDKKGTRWKFSWIPLGGYVKFFGDLDAASRPDRESESTLSPEERSLTLQSKPVFQRMAISAAGPFANFILAIVIFTAFFATFGRIVVPPVVGEVVPGSAAQAAGIKPGDLVQSINGKAIYDYQQLPQIIRVSAGEDLAITLLRGKSQLTVHATPRITKLDDGLGGTSNAPALGVKSSPKVKLVHISLNPLQALGMACQETWDIAATSLSGFKQMILGRTDSSQLTGTLGMAKVSQKVAEQGFLALVGLVALISVSLGLVNLFPIPVLDGGHLLYYACEAVLGRPLGERVQEAGFRFGLVLVIGLMIFSVWNDMVHHLNLF